MRRVIVNIDSLVLKGFRYGDRHTIAAALQYELTQVLAGRESAERIAEAGDVPRMRIGNISVGPSAKPRQVGAETGRAVGRGLLK
jgi:hypothetical protein